MYYTYFLYIFHISYPTCLCGLGGLSQLSWVLCRAALSLLAGAGVISKLDWDGFHLLGADSCGCQSRVLSGRQDTAGIDVSRGQLKHVYGLPAERVAESQEDTQKGSQSFYRQPTERTPSLLPVCSLGA